MSALGEGCSSDHRDPDKKRQNGEKVQKVRRLDRFPQAKYKIKKMNS